MEHGKLLAPGHRACPGCGVAVAVRQILSATGPNVIVVSPTGCLETFTSPYGHSAWEVPWIHPLFENAAAVASGIEAALKYRGLKDTPVVVMGGDGGTFDIGFGGLSGMFERGHNITYICYDNEAYMNTGIQRSSATPLGAATTTSPAGKLSLGKMERKKDMPAIAMAHGLDYVATAAICYPKDLMQKVKKAVSFTGPKYIQVHTPCCVGWGFEPALTVEMARLAVQTGLMPIFAAANGEISAVRKIGRVRPVKEYIEKQARFKHLFNSGPEGLAVLERIQELANKNIAVWGLASRET